MRASATLDPEFNVTATLSKNMVLPTAASLAVRDVLASAWPLFQVSLPRCLPLAVLGVAASGTPVAEGNAFSREWWGVYLASMVLMLICYESILRLQLQHALGLPGDVMKALKTSAIHLPGSLAVVVLVLVASILGLLCLLLPGLAVSNLLCLAWVARIGEQRSAMDALKRSWQLVRPHFWPVAAVLGAALAAILVFVLLTGIFMAVIMNLAGLEAQTSHGALSFSRWLMAAVLALPVIYVGAVTVSLWRRLVASLNQRSIHTADTTTNAAIK
jgi:hypothetical protein